MSYSRQAAVLEARLMAAEPVRFAGLYVDDGADFKVVVRLVGDADGLLRRYTTDPVFVAEKAPVPLRALENKKAALVNALKGGEGRFAVSLNTRTGRLRVFASNTQAARNAVGKSGITTEDVEFEEGGLPTTTANVFGGGTINGQVYCESSGVGCKQENGTTGFTVTNGTVRGILTAGHFGECTNMPSSCIINSPATDQSGAALTFKGQKNAGSEDFEWRTGPAGTVYPNAIRYSTTTMSITAVGDPTTYAVGTTVCKQGRVVPTYTCGTIEERNYSYTYNGTIGYFVRVKRNASGYMCQGGDSGGPLFVLNTALGLTQAAFFTGTYQYHCVFMPVKRISSLGLSVVVTQ